ncbi:hypothetical protein Anapl_09693 [Anas platyrhynchos]|uniref:Uncharacterized protein n=1 Tax=Anas platyrhynchos TaxID=8839 RepID=R0LZT9_ANAPL|nr:hypothetical protein Anapl_09693 [Anas platyrhynchos]
MTVLKMRSKSDERDSKLLRWEWRALKKFLEGLEFTWGKDVSEEKAFGSCENVLVMQQDGLAVLTSSLQAYPNPRLLLLVVSLFCLRFLLGQQVPPADSCSSSHGVCQHVPVHIALQSDPKIVLPNLSKIIAEKATIKPFMVEARQFNTSILWRGIQLDTEREGTNENFGYSNIDRVNFLVLLICHLAFQSTCGNGLAGFHGGHNNCTYSSSDFSDVSFHNASTGDGNVNGRGLGERPLCQTGIVGSSMLASAAPCCSRKGKRKTLGIVNSNNHPQRDSLRKRNVRSSNGDTEERANCKNEGYVVSKPVPLTSSCNVARLQYLGELHGMYPGIGCLEHCTLRSQRPTRGLVRPTGCGVTQECVQLKLNTSICPGSKSSGFTEAPVFTLSDCPLKEEWHLHHKLLSAAVAVGNALFLCRVLLGRNRIIMGFQRLLRVGGSTFGVVPSHKDLSTA